MGSGSSFLDSFWREVHRMAHLSPGVQARPPSKRRTNPSSSKPNTHPDGPGKPYQPISIPFFLSYEDRGSLSISWPRFQRTPSLASVARMVWSLTPLSVIPSLEAHFGSHRKGPEGTPFAELPRDCGGSPVGPRSLTLVEGGVDLLGTRGAGLESSKTILVEVVDGIAHRLGATPEILGYARWMFSARAPAKRIWQRLKTKASEERNPPSRSSRSLNISLVFEISIQAYKHWVFLRALM